MYLVLILTMSNLHAFEFLFDILLTGFEVQEVFYWVLKIAK